MHLTDTILDLRARRILWLDAGAGGVVGLAMLVLRDWLTGFYGLPLELIVLIGSANVVYASFSGTLAVRAAMGRRPSRRAIDVLVAANLSWSVVCAAMLFAMLRDAGAFGLAHIGLEGAFVTGLAVVEWRVVRPFAR